MGAKVVSSELKGPEIDQCTPSPGTDEDSTVQARNGTDLDNSALLAAPRYIRSLPWKNIRSKLVDASNTWFESPDDRVSIIKGVIDDLLNATLILDDIHDESLLRRGHPAAHCIFGSTQCINSGTNMFLQAAARIYKQRTKTPQAMGAFFDGSEICRF